MTAGKDDYYPSGKLKPKPGYEIGYAKPPKETRFKPGRSGNPRGRPKGAKNKRPALHEERLKGIILDEASREIEIREGSGSVTIPMAQAVMRSIAVNVAKGQPRAQRLFAELLAQTESANKHLHDEWVETAIEYKVGWERELQRREGLGITHLPEPLPHPDNVIVDLREGTVKVIGPATKEEKASDDDLIARRKEFAEEANELEVMIASTADPKAREFFKEDLARSKRIIEIIDGLLGQERRPG